MSRRAETDFPIHDLIRDRWSPRSFSDESIDVTTVRRLFEAARWAPSCFNEQPWRFIVARKEQQELFAKILDLLAEANQRWARRAPVLAISLASTTFQRDGRSNRHALHDVGAAVAQLTLEATSMGLAVHQMAGFDAERSLTAFSVPEGIVAVAALAIGHVGDAGDLPDPLREREAAPRVRHAQDAFVFGDVWGEGTELG